jgi:hypothetical protein
MRHQAMHNSSRGSPAVRLRRACATATGLLAISLLAAACGGGSPPGATRPGPVAQGLAYSACMRAHGVKNFPDPATGPNGHVTLSGAGIDMNSPQVLAAEHACRSLDPEVGFVGEHDRLGPVAQVQLGARLVLGGRAAAILVCPRNSGCG